MGSCIQNSKVTLCQDQVGTQGVSLEVDIMMVVMVTALTEVVGSTMGEMRTVASTVVKMRVVSMLVMAETATGVILRVAVRMLMMVGAEVGTLEKGKVDFMVILGTPEVTVTMRGLMVTAMNMAVASMMGETMAVGEIGSKNPSRKFIYISFDFLQ